MSNSKVIVSNPAENENVNPALIVDGVIVRKEQPGSDGEIYGSIMFESRQMVLSRNFLNEQNRMAFINGKVSTLQKYVNALGLKPGEVVPGYRIVVKESFKPSYEGHQPKINPNTNVEVTKDGMPIYRETLLVEEGSDERDVFIQHDVVSTRVKETVKELMDDLGSKK